MLRKLGTEFSWCRVFVSCAPLQCTTTDRRRLPGIQCAFNFLRTQYNLAIFKERFVHLFHHEFVASRAKLLLRRFIEQWTHGLTWCVDGVADFSNCDSSFWYSMWHEFISKQKLYQSASNSFPGHSYHTSPCYRELAVMHSVVASDTLQFVIASLVA